MHNYQLNGCLKPKARAVHQTQTIMITKKISKCSNSNLPHKHSPCFIQLNKAIAIKLKTKVKWLILSVLGLLHNNSRLSITHNSHIKIYTISLSNNRITNNRLSSHKLNSSNSNSNKITDKIKMKILSTLAALTFKLITIKNFKWLVD